MKKRPSKALGFLGLMELGRLGEVPIRVVAANLQVVMGASVDILEPQAVPGKAFQQHRQQYDAGLILKSLATLSLPGHERILALTTVDLCSPVLTYVYGEAEVGGKMAVASSFRLRSNDDGSLVPLDRYYERLAKVALHEVAHTLSLYHCDAPRCLMRFSARVHHLDSLDIGFCERCEFMLRQNLRRAGSPEAFSD
jgi:archaemetzincin